MNGPIDFGAINRAALAAFPAVLARILPGGKRVGAEIVALNPRRADRRLGSFKVNRFNGRWCDFATGDKGGDVVSLVAYPEGVSQGEAARRLARMLGLEIGAAPSWMTHSKNPLRLLLDRCSRLRTRAMNRNPWQPAARKTPNVEPRSIGFGSKSLTLFRSPERRARNI